MEALVFVFLGVVGLVLMVLSASRNLDAETKVVFALGSLVSWAVWALQAGNVTRVSNGVIFEESYLSLMILGVLFAGLMVVVVYQRALELFNT